MDDLALPAPARGLQHRVCRGGGKQATIYPSHLTHRFTGALALRMTYRHLAGPAPARGVQHS